MLRRIGVAKRGTARLRKLQTMAAHGANTISTMYVKGFDPHGEGQLTRGDCPFCHRTNLHLQELGLSGWSEQFIDLAYKPDWFTSEISPDGKVPAAVLTSGDAIADSQAIIDRVEQETGNSLPPADEHQKQLEEGFLPSFVKFLKGEQDESALVDKLIAISDYLKNTSSGHFIAGEQPGAVDCSLAPKVHAMRVALNAHKGWRMPDSVSEPITSYLNAWAERSSWRNSSYSDDSVIEGWRKHLQ